MCEYTVCVCVFPCTCASMGPVRFASHVVRMALPSSSDLFHLVSRQLSESVPVCYVVIAASFWIAFLSNQYQFYPACFLV